MGNQTAVKMRVDLERVNKIAKVLADGFGEDIFDINFEREFWIALQVIYGPYGAAEFIRRCQNPE